MKKTLSILLIFSLFLLGSCTSTTSTTILSSTTSLTTSSETTTSTTVAVISPDSIGTNSLTSSSLVLPDWIDDAVMYEVNVRQYTEEGTFAAFQEALPRLQELGVEVLWFMPIHEISWTHRIGTLGSYYAITDYDSINPEFGTLEDFHNLVSEAKSLGFKIVMDIVFDHTGWDSPWITEHPEYYIQVNGEIVIPRGTNWQDVAELDTSRQDVITELGNVLSYWASEFGIDGFRCDFASGVEASTWEVLRAQVEAINPEIFFLAEDDSIYSWFDTFNANYGGWSLLTNLQNVYHGTATKWTLINYLKQANAKYPEGAFSLNFITNHDINSWDGTIESRLGSSADVMTMLTFTLPGMPLIYSGQESSLEHPLAFFDKDLITWNGYDLQPFLEGFVNLKKTHEALYNTNFSNSTDFLYNANSKLLSYVRFDVMSGDQVLVLANLSSTTVTTSIHFDTYSGVWTNYETNEQVAFDPIDSVSVPGYGFVIYTK